jgi:sec-independent protein translocase protein TatA
MLNNIGLPGLLLIAVVVLVLFGRGKISSLMGEVGKGITAFKRGVKDGSEEIENAAAEPHDATRDPVRRDLPGERARDVTPPATPGSTPSPAPQTTDRG